VPFAAFMTFLRDPFDRAVSAYNHWVTHNGYHGSFGDFIALPSQQNRMSCLVGGIPLDAYAFIGLYESFAEDMRRLAVLLGLPPSQPRVNVGNYARIDKDRLLAEHGAYFRSTNAEDYDLLERVRQARARAGAGNREVSA
jgi:hypothetical protein